MREIQEENRAYSILRLGTFRSFPKFPFVNVFNFTNGVNGRYFLTVPAVNFKKLPLIYRTLPNLIQYTIEHNCCSQDNFNIQTIENNFFRPSCSDYPDHPKLLGELNTGADSTHGYRQKRHHLCSQCKLIFSFI